MVIAAFPPHSSADEHGLLALGGDLEPESLILAYSSGIFPWPWDEDSLAWFSPPTRAILFLEELHISRRLKETLRKGLFHFEVNRDFPSVIRACAESANRKGQSGTWITEGMIDAYIELNRLGLCYSFESYHNQKLVGGLYGVRLKNFFAAESSFYIESDASKCALCFMAETLSSQGITWIDCQVLTPFSRSFGAREVPRAKFLSMLKKALLSLALVMTSLLISGWMDAAHADPVWRCGEVFSSTYREGCTELDTGMAKGITGERVFAKSRKDAPVITNEPHQIPTEPGASSKEPAEDPRLSGTIFETTDSRRLASSSGPPAPQGAGNVGDIRDPDAALAFIRCISEAFKGNKAEAAKCGLPNLDFSEINNALK